VAADKSAFARYAGLGLIAIQKLAEVAPQSGHNELYARLLDYAVRVEELRSPDELLGELHDIVSRDLPLSVLGAARFPLKSSDWDAIQLGTSLFLHKDAPDGWWQEYHDLARGRCRPLLFLAQTCMASSTWTEVRRILQPIGGDQWSYELALKYGIRDGLTCPVGGRWVVVFWSRRDLSNILTRPLRIIVIAAASFAGMRLEQLAPVDPRRITLRARLTPRELAVLRLVSTGAQTHDIAKALELGVETVRSHLKKAQTKLGARTRTHAVAESLRQSLIP
jgi:LuxR family quorum sensing-dependent transcriptional regulator